MPWNLIFAAHSLSDCLLQRKKACCCNNWQADCCNIAYIVRRFPFRFPFLLTYHKIIIKCKTYKRSNGKGGIRTPGAWQHNTLAKYHLNPLDHFSKSWISPFSEARRLPSRFVWRKMDAAGLEPALFPMWEIYSLLPSPLGLRILKYYVSVFLSVVYGLLSMVILYHTEQCKFALL